jgi:hypothetical protein
MAEILKNSNSPVYHQVFWRGNVVDADNLPTVEIYDITETPEEENPGLTILLDTITAEKDETNVGLYAAHIPLPYTSNTGTLRLVWNYEVDSEEFTYRHDVFVVTPYADLYQSAYMLGVSTDPSDPNYKSFSELAAAERYARQRIEDYTGQQFYLYSDIHRVMGTGSDTLPLPDRLHTIHKLYLNDIVLIDNTAYPAVNNWGYNVQVSETGFGIRVNRAEMLDNTVYIANGMVPPTIHDGQGVFKNGAMYEVQGKFGWKKVPDKVELAAIELMKDFFAKDNTWKNQYISTIQTFDWQFEYSPEVFMGTGNAYADRLLSDFIVNKASLI